MVDPLTIAVLFGVGVLAGFIDAVAGRSELARLFGADRHKVAATHD